MYKYFKDIPLGAHFVNGGTRWVKTSSRTCRDIDYSHKVFYIGKLELCSAVKVPFTVYA